MIPAETQLARFVFVAPAFGPWARIAAHLRAQGHTVAEGETLAQVASAMVPGGFEVLVAAPPVRAQDLVALRHLAEIEAMRAAVCLVGERTVAEQSHADPFIPVSAQLAESELLVRVLQLARSILVRRERDQSVRMQEELMSRLGNAEALAERLSRAICDVGGRVHRALGQMAEGIGMRSSELIHPLEANVGRVAMLVGRAREFAMPVTMRVERVPVRELLAAAVTEAQVGGAQAQPTLRVRCPAGQPDWFGDRQALTQCLAELLRNAAAVGGGGAQIELTAWRTSHEHGVDVSDDGPGIPWERRAEIWLPFQHALRGGVGLGLATCRKVAAAHGGELVLLSPTRRGARFRLRFPLAAGSNGGAWRYGLAAE